MAWDNRQLKVSIYAGQEVLDLTGYHLTIDVDLIRHKRQPNKATVEIYNLGVVNRGRISGDHQGVEIVGGYDAPGLLFRGVTTSVVPVDSKPDNLLVVNAIDGGAKWDTTWTSRSWDQGTTLVQVLGDVASDLGLPASVLVVGTLTAPRVANGRPKDVLTQICLDYNLHWSIQNEVVEVVGDNDTFDKSVIPMVDLSPATGLIGSPSIEELERKKGKRRWGIVCRSLLNPHIRPNSMIQISGSTVTGSTVRTKKGKYYQRPGANGIFRVTRVNHRGGLHLNEFYSDIEGEYLA